MLFSGNWVSRSLADLVNDEPDLEVCGQAANAADALECVHQERPDVIICDLTLNGTNGLDLIKRLRARDPEITVLVSSMHDESVYAERVLKAGGMGYINKQETIDKLVDAIHTVLEGKVCLSDKMTERMLRRRVGSQDEAGRSSIEGLTDRELEVFRLLGDGQTTKQTAETLKLSVKTIESHRENIKSKLGARQRDRTHPPRRRVCAERTDLAERPFSPNPPHLTNRLANG